MLSLFRRQYCQPLAGFRNPLRRAEGGNPARRPLPPLLYRTR